MLTFNKNYSQNNNYDIYPEDYYQSCHMNLIDNFSEENPTINKESDDDYSGIKQNDYKSQIEDIMFPSQQIEESLNFNEVIKDKEDLKDNNNNNNPNFKITDINLEETQRATLLKKKSESKITINDNKNENKIKNIDNKIRKAKIIIINVIRQYINNQILKIYNRIKDNGIFSTLRKIDTSKISCAKKDFNMKLMEKSFKEIISLEINGKYTSPPSNVNERIINKLLNEKDESKRKIFNDLFNKSLKNWINDLKDPKDELKIIYEEELRLKDDQEEIDEVIKNFENIIQKKRAKKNKNIK